MIMMCQCCFISCNKCTTLVGDVNNKRVYACVEVRDIWEISVSSSQFCCEPQIALKKLFLKNSVQTLLESESSPSP